MRTDRGFALAVVLFLMPVMAMLAWTFLKVGSVTRARAVSEERSVRALHAAEAGVRSYLTTGRADSFEMNGCRVVTTLSSGRILFTATPIHGTQGTTITLEVEKGFVSRRTTNEQN